MRPSSRISMGWLVGGLLLAGCRPPSGVSPDGSVPGPLPAAAAEGGSLYALAVEGRPAAGKGAHWDRGRRLYAKYCSICHGDRGDGQGFNAYPLKDAFGVVMKDYTKAESWKELPREGLVAAMRDGVTGKTGAMLMPPYGRLLAESERHALLVFLESLRPGE